MWWFNIKRIEVERFRIGNKDLYYLGKIRKGTLMSCFDLFPAYWYNKVETIFKGGIFEKEVKLYFSHDVVKCLKEFAWKECEGFVINDIQLERLKRSVEASVFYLGKPTRLDYQFCLNLFPPYWRNKLEINVMKDAFYDDKIGWGHVTESRDNRYLWFMQMKKDLNGFESWCVKKFMDRKFRRPV